MRRLVVGQSFAKRRILACESILIATQLYTSGTAATPTKAEENVGGSRLCRPPSVPTHLLCTKREQNSEPPKLTNAFILEFLRSRLSPLQTVGTGGNDESKSLIAKSKSVAKVEKGMKASASFVNKSKSTSSIYGSGEMLSLDCRADLAAWSLVHDKEGDDDQRSSIPRVEYSSASHTYLVKSGGIHLGSVGLEGVHAALEKKINAMISHSNAERRNSTTKSADVGSHCSVPFVIGTDEAGRGPLAGPVVCAAYSRLLVKESPRYREDKIVEGVKSPSLSPTKVFLEPVTVRDYTCIDGEEERGARNGGSGCVHFPFSSLPTTSLRGGHFPLEVVPAMDSKQFPTGERRYAFKALVTGESVSSECGSPVSEPPQIIPSSSSSSSTLSFSSGESFLRSLESLIGGELDFEKVVPEKNLLPAESVSFHTITNPLPVELALSISGGSDSNSQRLVPLVGEDYEKLMRRVCIDSDHEHNNVKSNLRGQPQSRKFICLERLLRAAGEKDHPPLITTIAFRSIVKVPRPQSSSSSLSSSPSSVTVHSEDKGKIENNGSEEVHVAAQRNPVHASSTAAEVPLTIGNVRAALKAFDEAVKIGSKALTSAEKKAAKATAKAQRETDKKAVKLMKAESKKEARAAAHSKDECVGDACEVGEEQEQGILVQKELSSLPPPLDWQPDGLHASLKAIWDAHEQLYGKQKPIGAERDTNATEGETERENIPNHYYYIQHGAVSIVNHVFIDATNILAASMHGMTAAVRAVNASVIETQASLEVAGKSSKTISSLSSSSHDGVRTHNLPAVVLVDGSQAPGDLVRLTTDAKEGDAHPRVGAVIPITKGDSTSYSIAAASLLAKSTRDAIMGFYGSSRMYPEYGLADHEGYPCPSHRNAIIQHGLSPIHRKTFGPCRAVMLSKKNA